MTKEELRAYRQKKLEADQIEQMIARLESEMYSPTSVKLDTMPRAASTRGSGPTERLALRHIELVDRYRDKLEELRADQLRIEKAIEILEPTERMLIRYRYIEGLTWEVVAVRMNYSWRQMHRIHGKALKHLAE